MQMVRIRFSDPAKEAKGFVALAERMSVICLAGSTNEIAKSGLKILNDLGIDYEVVAEEGFDRACHALRNSPAAKV